MIEDFFNDRQIQTHLSSNSRGSQIPIPHHQDCTTKANKKASKEHLLKNQPLKRHKEYEARATSTIPRVVLWVDNWTQTDKILTKEIAIGVSEEDFPRSSNNSTLTGAQINALPANSCTHVKLEAQNAIPGTMEIPQYRCRTKIIPPRDGDGVEHSFKGKIQLQISEQNIEIHSTSGLSYQVYYRREGKEKASAVSFKESHEILAKNMVKRGKVWYCNFEPHQNECHEGKGQGADTKKRSFENHLAPYLLTYRCNFCHKKYGNYSNLFGHLNTHAANQTKCE